ncbi:MAG: DUF1080 domain-containing protein [Candidatus Hydrogenedentes bacterium]|nr:DUF1080 domain-containing protein [Candidatus Hydrogenedentota bacterium]
MNRTLRGLLITGILGICVCGLASAEPPSGEGWQSLFDGKSLAGWAMKSENKDAGIWKVADATIDCNPRADLKGDNSLWSDKSFKDFELSLDWRIKETHGEYPVPTVLPDGTDKKGPDGKPIVTMMPNADSGIYLRGASKAQVNIWCWPIGSGEVYGYRMDDKMPADVRAGVTPKLKADKPVGEWNNFVISMKGELLTVKLNGKTVIENAKLPGVPETGQIALQSHGGFDPKTKEWNSASSLVQFRNLYIRELKDGAK